MRKHGVSKVQLAKIAGVGPSAVTKWANGGEIRPRNLEQIANQFGLPVGFFYNSFAVKRNSTEVKEVDSSNELAAENQELKLELAKTQGMLAAQKEMTNNLLQQLAATRQVPMPPPHQWQAGSAGSYVWRPSSDAYARPAIWIINRPR